MRYIEADGARLAHIAASHDDLKALCGLRPFPWEWAQPVTRSKPVCRTCTALLDKQRRQKKAP